MTVNVGELVATMRLDDAAFRNSLRRMPSDTTQGVREASNAGEREAREGGSRAGTAFSGGMKAMLGAAAGVFAGGAILAFMKDSIAAASDFNETASKAGQIFASSYGKVQQWSKTAAVSMGLSQSAALDAAAGFGNMFTQLGFAGDAAADMSTKTVQMAADLGSFNNLPTADVAEKISGAFRGEYDSLQALIPNISAARVEQEAMTETGKTNVAALTAAEKATAVLTIVQQDGAKAMGDYARTADGAANTEKTLAARFEDTKVAIGEKLLPAWNAFLQVLSAGMTILSGAISVISDLVDWFTQLPGPVQAGAIAFAAWVTVGPAVLAFLTGLVERMAVALITSQGMAAGMRSAGTAILGAFGGGIGLAILGVTAALGFFMSRTKETTTTVTDFSTAIDENSGLLRANSDAELAAALAQSGHLQSYKAIGGSVSDYTEALKGNEAAQNAVHSAILASAVDTLKTSGAWQQMVDTGTTGTQTVEEFASSLLGSGDAASQSAIGIGTAAEANRNFASDVDLLGAAAEAGAAKTDVLADSAAKSGDAAATAAPSMDALKAATKDFQSAASGADVATQFLTASLNAMHGESLTAEAATRLFEASVRSITQASLDQKAATDNVSASQIALRTAQDDLKTAQDALKTAQDSGTASADQLRQAADAVTTAQNGVNDAQRGVTEATLKTKDADDQFTDAQLKSRDAGLALAGQAYDTARAHGTLTDASLAATNATEQARESFVRASVDAGMEETAARQLADKLFGIPGEVATTFIQHGQDDAIAKTDALNAVLDQLNNRTVRYQVVGDQVMQFEYGYTPADLHAEGGLIRGPGTGTSDSIPARLSNEEFVVKSSMSKRYRNELFAMNAGRYAEGGVVGARRYANTVISELGQGTTSRVGSPIGKIPAPPTPQYSVGAGVEQWRGLALQALAMTGQDASNVSALLHQMDTESSGNPAAINLTDINAQRGDPSIGLMQVIGSTFRAYAMPGFSSNIYDPLSNILASIRYALAAYGSLGAAYRGVAYDTGGPMLNGTGGYNTSGDTEWVLTGPQARAAGLLPGGGLSRKAIAPAAASNGAQAGWGPKIAFTGDIRVGEFATARSLLDHAQYASL